MNAKQRGFESTRLYLANGPIPEQVGAESEQQKVQVEKERIQRDEELKKMRDMEAKVHKANQAEQAKTKFMEEQRKTTNQHQR